MSEINLSEFQIIGRRVGQHFSDSTRKQHTALFSSESSSRRCIQAIIIQTLQIRRRIINTTPPRKKADEVLPIHSKHSHKINSPRR